MQKNISIGIVEDDVLIADGLRRQLESWGYRVFDPVATYDQAIAMVDLARPDLVILDIHISGEKSGIEIGAYLSGKNIPFIYLTAQYDEATLSLAKRTYPSSYITKPYMPENLKASVAISLHNFEGKRQKDLIELKDGHTRLMIDKNEILYISADHIYVDIHLLSQKHTVRKSMKEILDELGEGFRQVHRSYAVNMNQVTRISASKLWLGLQEIPFGRSFREDFFSRS